MMLQSTSDMIYPGTNINRVESRSVMSNHVEFCWIRININKVEDAGYGDDVILI